MGELCNSVGVRGYPTIKTGSPDDLQDYKGGRDFASLKKHAETLGPSCGPANLDLCDDDKKKQIEEFKALGAEKREAIFKDFVEGLNKAYKEESDKKEKAVEAIKNSGLGLLKSVHKFAATASTKSEL